MPLFSILMPSRNRGHLLAESVKTILGQDFSDYELIISDNNSTDHTKQVAESVMEKSSQCRYVNPGKDLSMVDHFEFISTKANGDYLLFLSDDDGLIDKGLRYLAEVINTAPHNPEIIVWQRAGYGWPDLGDHPNCEYLAFRLRSGKTFEVKSSLIIDALCNFDAAPNIHFVGPKITNCAISRIAFARPMKRTGRFFLPPYPDYSTLCQLLSTHSSYTLIDQTLYICGSSVAANSAIHTGRKKKIAEYNSLFSPEEITLDAVRYPMEFLTNSAICATYMKFQRLYPETFTANVNWRNYLAALYAELEYHEHFEDTTAEMEQLRIFMRQETGDDTFFDSLCNTVKGGNRRAAILYQLRKLAATNAATRLLTSTTMRLLGIKNSDARQFSHVKDIVTAASIVTGELTKVGRLTTTLPTERLDRPEQLTLLA